MCLDPSSVSLYDSKSSPRPVEIRKKLESLGVDVSDLKDLYQVQSSISHVGNPYDYIQIKWTDMNKGHFCIGGGSNSKFESISLNFISTSIFLFLRHDPNYIISS